jgi:hypothetical protein
MDVHELRQVIQRDYPELTVVTQLDIAGRGPCLIVEGPRSEGLVDSAEELDKLFRPKLVSAKQDDKQRRLFG